jgi:hypothetical protein
MTKSFYNVNQDFVRIFKKSCQGNLTIFFQFFQNPPRYQNNQNGANNYPSKQSNTSTTQSITTTLDPWAIAVPPSFGKPWNELNLREKQTRVLIGVAKGIGLLALLYFFVCSLDLLSLGFRIVGGRTTGKIFSQSEILKVKRCYGKIYNFMGFS